MHLLATLPAAVVETLLTHLAVLFLTAAGNDAAAARQAAASTLASYRPETPDELRLAANIVLFGFQALEALGQAAAADLPLTRILRLRGGAVSLSREAAKAERRLGQLQQARRQPAPAEPIEVREPIEARAIPAPPEAKPEPPARTLGPVAAAAKANGLTWTKAFDQRQRDIRIAANVKKAEARMAAGAAASNSSPQAQPA